MLRRAWLAVVGKFVWLVDGPRFKRFTQPNPPAVEEKFLRVAVCALIPHLGDTAMIFPVLDALAEANPGIEITCFVQGMGRHLALHPGVKAVYEFKRPRRWTRYLGTIGYILDLRAWWKRDLRDLRFDACVVPRGGVEPYQSAYLAWMLGGKTRAAYAEELEPERLVEQLHKSAFLTHEVRRLNLIHEVSRGWEVLQLAGLVQEPLDLTNRVASILQIAQSRAAQEYVGSFPELQRPYALIAPGASISRRMWPAERFLSLVRNEILPRGWFPVFVGGPELVDLCSQMQRDLGCASLNLAGRTDFVQLVGVCAGAEVFLGNDSGVGHLAGACGVPSLVVTAYAARSLASHHASAERSHPVGPYFSVVQPEYPRLPCTEECVALEPHCILDASVEMAGQVLRELLARASSEAP